MVLWQLFSQQLPYQGMDPAEIIAFVQRGAALPSSDAVTPALLELVNVCRTADPKQRPHMTAVSKCLNI